MNEGSKEPNAGRFGDRVVIAGRVLGSLGMVSLISTLLTYALTREVGWMISAKLGFGAVALMLYFVTNSSELFRFFGARATMYTAASGIATGGFVLLMAAANFLGAMSNREIDLTRDRLHSLSDQTDKVLRRLDRDVVFIGFYRPEEPERTEVEALLTRYRSKNAHVGFSFRNPEKDPEAAKASQITQSGPRLVIRSGAHELAAPGRSESDRPAGSLRSPQMKVRHATEEEITNAIVKVAQQATKKIAFLTGHGEPPITDLEAEGMSELALALRDEGYEVEELALFDKQSVPEDVAALVIAAPAKPLLEPEVAMLRGFMALGGHLLVMLEPRNDAGLAQLLDDWRVGLGADTVIDPNPMSRAFGFGPEMPIIQKLEPHPITQGMKASVAFPTVRSARALPGGGSRPTPVEVVRTSEQAWGEMRYEAGAAMQLDPEDVRGPVPLMVASTKASAAMGAKPTDQSRMLVVGDHEFATNRFLVVLGNKDLFLNAVNWLAQEEERISIRPKRRGASRLLVTENEASFIRFFAVDVIPMTLLAVGVAVWQLRRRK
ncbi:MAG: Gldg family protein [Deltaproteobacteria bacterium]|nr:Gldg family protein [Deltaproteobacteria bacterium]